MAGNTGVLDREARVLRLSPFRLMSYHYIIEELFNCDKMFAYAEELMKKNKKKIELFLDSGAFSAFTQGVEIDIEAYIKFIKKHKKYISVYANLDCIGDPSQTLKNQTYMESKGLKPLPCFHYGEDVNYLKKYLKKYDYVALGGMVPISTPALGVWLDSLFTKYLTDSKGNPLAKIHGFGLTSLPLMLRYPWYSVDSTSWVLSARMGTIFVPRMREGKYIYNEQSWKVTVSTRSPKKNVVGQHINTLSPTERKIILSYFKSKGFALGKSEFKTVSSDHKLMKKQRWAGKAEDGMREMEIVKEAGLSNDYKQRDELNIMYFMDLEKSIPKWPWVFRHGRTSEGFGL